MQCLCSTSGNTNGDDFVFGRCNFAGVLLMSFDCILVDVIGDNNEDDSLVFPSKERASVVLGSL